MSFNFELLLTFLTFLSGILWLLDACFLARRRQQIVGLSVRQPLWAEYARSFFPIFLLVLILRSFIAEPYRIPSGSDKPTLLIGDFLIANKFAYGLRLPVLHTKFLNIGKPKTGDIILFRYPIDPSMNFIKRVIGVPGDKIEYIDKVLLINGNEAPQELLSQTTDVDEAGRAWPVMLKSENLQGIKHDIYLRLDSPAQDFSITVPPGEYFVMGDNRDDSNDSRYWGFVPEANLVGKAYRIVFSWDYDQHKVRWNRIGQKIQ